MTSKPPRGADMYTMIIVLKREKLLKKLTSILLEFGMFESTVLDGEGIENLAAQTNPVFSSLRSLFSDEYVYNKTIITPVEDRETIDGFLSLCKKEGIDFQGDDIGSVMAFPCELVIT